MIGIDLADGMARETQREIERRGLKQAEARQMDAEHLTFPDSSILLRATSYSRSCKRLRAGNEIHPPVFVPAPSQMLPT